MYNNIGSRVKEIRKRLNLTQAKFGKQLGVTHSHISKLETSTEMPSDTLLRLISLEFGINESWLRDGEGQMLNDVYEDDPEVSDVVFNRGMDKMKELLTTDSNVKYAHLTFSLDSFVNIVDYKKIPDVRQSMYLEHIELLLADIERYNSFLQALLLSNRKFESTEEQNRLVENHQTAIKERLDKLYTFYLSTSEK